MKFKFWLKNTDLIPQEVRENQLAFYKEGVEDIVERAVVKAVEKSPVAGLLMGEGMDYQARVGIWLVECFGTAIASDKEERNYRFGEESLELIQALGCTKEKALELVEYVYGRPLGEPHQEVGGVMVTLAALCRANDMDMKLAGETELARVWTKIEQIRAKQAAKTIKGGALP